MVFGAPSPSKYLVISSLAIDEYQYSSDLYTNLELLHHGGHLDLFRILQSNIWRKLTYGMELE